MDFSEKWGTDVDTAVELALQDLKLTKEEVVVTVLEEPTKGFFGIGSKLALVRVEKKGAESTKVSEAPKKAKEATTKKEEPKVSNRVSEVKATPKEELKEKVSSKPLDEDANAAISFLNDVVEKMGLSLDISATYEEESLHIDIKGADSGTIIGKRGQTLDAIQYLTSLVINKENKEYKRVVVDAENYRTRREATLMQLANRLEKKVIKNKKSVRLEPMNPYERKVIHATLQESKSVKTRSEGEDPYRRVVIELK